MKKKFYNVLGLLAAGAMLLGCSSGGDSGMAGFLNYYTNNHDSSNTKIAKLSVTDGTYIDSSTTCGTNKTYRKLETKLASSESFLYYGEYQHVSSSKSIYVFMNCSITFAKDDTVKFEMMSNSRLQAGDPSYEIDSGYTYYCRLNLTTNAISLSDVPETLTLAYLKENKKDMSYECSRLSDGDWTKDEIQAESEKYEETEQGSFVNYMYANFMSVYKDCGFTIPTKAE